MLHWHKNVSLLQLQLLSANLIDKDEFSLVVLRLLSLIYQCHHILGAVYILCSGNKQFDNKKTNIGHNYRYMTFYIHQNDLDGSPVFMNQLVFAVIC